MFETLDRLFLAGLGAISMTRERAEELYEEAVRRGEVQRTGRTQFVEDLLSTASRTRDELGELVARQVRDAIASLNLATREDIARLEAKIDRALTPDPSI